MSCFGYRLQDGVLIQGRDGAQINDLGVDTIFSKLISSSQGIASRHACPNERYVFPSARTSSLTKRHDIFAFGHLAFELVHCQVLTYDDGVSITQSGG